MNRLSLFSSPFLLGFDDFERTFDRVSKSANDGYPPYNIEQLDETSWRIVLALAGFSADDISAQREDNQLIIVGNPAKNDERTYLHKGIGARAFQRRFILADGIEIAEATLENGLLVIVLVRPDSKPRIQPVPIKSSASDRS
jgi:HSP20 family molecular chaperone IbpA